MGTENIQERINRFIANVDWVSLFPDFEVVHLLRQGLDHCVIQIKWYHKRNKGAEGNIYIKKKGLRELMRGEEEMWAQRSRIQ
ncbi:hypothetical protein P3X46_034716 [Hevea brasiliensis]|uniref:Uncharacterized protein n=1 Tax=Hevea brasiliensis TaxID=3981 RepID=A0ABQ9K886_HEVBR|nr:hypothetical protein P3X46_034716 [Hevea brasiliensis]